MITIYILPFFGTISCMCGIAGITNFSKKPQTKVLTKMLTQIKHRGPDSSGTFTSAHTLLGIQRLRIIDLITGDQPIHNEDKTVTVVFNGEIYNFRELREELINKKHIFYTQTDTEVLVHLYEEYGNVFPKKLNGMFAFALWDVKKKQLLLVRDQVGIKPLYYCYKDETLIFASELKAILMHPLISKIVDPIALQMYASFGYISQEKSIYRHINKLLPGHILAYTPDGLQKKRYWNIDEKNTTQFTPEELLADAVKKQSVADVPVGVLLSGGIDSSLITYFLSQVNKKKIHTFSIGFRESSFDESAYAYKVARWLGTIHHHEIIGADDLPALYSQILQKLDEPLGDASLIPTYKVAELAAKYVKVALCGDGGDELFAGYPTYQGHLLAEKVPYFLDPLIKFVNMFLNMRASQTNNFPKTEVLQIFLNDIFTDPYHRQMRWMKQLFGAADKWLLPEYKMKQPIDLYEINFRKTQDMVSELQKIDFATYLRDDLLVKSDRASMFHSLELRVPFLDIRVVQLALHLRSNQHVDLFSTKKLLRSIARHKLPKDIVMRKKKGFGIPLSRWLRFELKDWANEQLANERLYDFFDFEMISKAFSEHVHGIKNHSHPLWITIMFSGWLKKWL